LYLHPLQITIQQWPTTVSKGKSSIEGKNSGEVTPASPEARPVKKGRPVVGRRLHHLPQKIKKGCAAVERHLHHNTKKEKREERKLIKACTVIQQKENKGRSSGEATPASPSTKYIEGKNSGKVTPASPEARPVKKGRPVVGRRLHHMPQKIKKGCAAVKRRPHHPPTR
jgi:hypothetical protein